MALPAVEIDDRDLGDYERGEEDFWANNSDIGSRAKTGPNPEVEVDVELSNLGVPQGWIHCRSMAEAVPRVLMVTVIRCSILRWTFLLDPATIRLDRTHRENSIATGSYHVSAQVL